MEKIENEALQTTWTQMLAVRGLRSGVECLEMLVGCTPGRRPCERGNDACRLSRVEITGFGVPWSVGNIFSQEIF